MTYCALANYHFQGSAADGAKAGLADLMYAMYDNETAPVYGCRLLAFVHDEVIVSVCKDRVHEQSFAVRDIFVGGCQKFFPDVPITSSPAAMYAWSKAAGDPVFDANGKLIPWEDRAK